MPPRHLPLPDNMLGFGPTVVKCLSLVIENYEQFKAESDMDTSYVVASEREYVLGLSLHVEARLTQDPTGRKLRVSLVCTLGDSSRHSYNVALQGRLVGGQFVRKVHASALSGHTFSKEKNIWLYTLNEALVDGYLVNNTLNIQVDVREGIPFCQPYMDFTSRSSAKDVRIDVGVQQFFVNPGFMATVSPFFACCLSPNGGKDALKSVVLHDVSAAEFLEFLNAVHDLDNPVKERNVSTLLKLSKRFDATALIGKCESFLMKSGSTMLSSRIRVADRCQCASLRSYLIARCNRDDIKDFRRAGNHDELSTECLAELVRKSMTLAAQTPAPPVPRLLRRLTFRPTARL